jgi:Uncharacterised nucleotidyltransferase
MTSTPSGLVSSEKRLLAFCARTTAPEPVQDQIRKLCAAPLDWEFVVNESAVNSILPLVARQVSAAARDVAPPSVIDRLNKAARSNALRCLSLTAELIKVLDLLTAAGIQAMPYKGPVIAAQAYGDVALREFEDLDIIVRQRDMAKVDDVVKGLGYRPNHPWRFDPAPSSSVVPGEYDYRDEARGMIVEFHTEFTLRHFPVAPNLDEIFERLVPVMLGGHKVLTFSAEDMLTLLCVHGSKDFWERISWIADVSEFVRANPRLDWDAVFRRTDALSARRMVNVGLALASELLQAELPANVAARLERDSSAKAIASDISRRHLMRVAPERSAGERFRFRRRMVAGSVAGWRYAMRLTTQPADEDSAAMALPRPLAPVYALLRPFRLLRQYRPAGNRSSERQS